MFFKKSVWLEGHAPFCFLRIESPVQGPLALSLELVSRCAALQIPPVQVGFILCRISISKGTYALNYSHKNKRLRYENNLKHASP